MSKLFGWLFPSREIELKSTKRTRGNQTYSQRISKRDNYNNLPFKTIAVINQKGGVGKTTSTINIGAGLSRLKKKVLLIDFDPQANLTDGLGIDEDSLEHSIYDVIVGNCDIHDAIILKDGLSIVPSSMLLVRSIRESISNKRRNFMLRDALRFLDRNEFDYILIDCPPSLGFLSLNALIAAHEVYIPVQPEYLALKGIRKILNAVTYVNSHGNEDLMIKAIFGTRYDKRKKHHQEVVQKVKEYFGDQYLYAIRENITLAESTSYGKPVFNYQPKSHGAEDYMSLCRIILKLDGNSNHRRR